MQEKILLVDDDQNLLDACRRNLCKRFAVETALGPEAGLAALAERGPFAVVVSDMRMPGMDGVQFLNQVRRRAPGTMRMMLTGHPELQTAIDAVNEGNIFRFLTKPCPPELLVQAIEAAFEHRRLVRGQMELLETKLRHGQKMQVMGECAAGVFHELRNILTIIEMYAHIALAAQPEHPQLSKSLTQIQTAAANAARLTRQLVNFSRRKAEPQMAPLDLGAFLDQFAETLRHLLPRSIALECECAPGLPSMQGDAGALGQVLVNLALNARDAMPAGGTVRVRAALAPADGPGEDRGGPWLCLSVGDTGCGMDTAVRQRLFEPFFTTKEMGQGTGLGLAVVATIVEQHQGRVEVTSEPGTGSTFRVYLPARPNPVIPLPLAPPHECQEKNSVCG